MRLKDAITVGLIMLFIYSATALAGEFYLHDNDRYWWYYNDDPQFYAVVPNDGERYVTKTVFGYDFLEISWEEGTVILEVGSMVGNDTDTVINFVAKRWGALLEDELVFSNREITTSNGLNTYFYALEGVGPDGSKSMLRSVYFHKDDIVVYLAMYLPSNKYQGSMQNHWLRVVNDFEW